MPRKFKNSHTHTAHDTQPPFVVEYVKQPSLLERHITWLRNTTMKAGGFKTLLAILEASFLSLSIVGIPLMLRGAFAWRKQKVEKAFQNSLKKISPPHANEVIVLPSETRTFNHISEYAIENDVIWHRKRSSQQAWQPIFFDGYPNRKPKIIDVDGANLIIIDDKNSVHYKKVLKEFRASEIKKIKSRHFNEQARKEINKLSKTSYVAVDKSDLNNWKKKWFSLPFFYPIVNLIKGKRIKIKTDVKSVVISHRGRYNDYIRDAAGQKHPVSTGVTTLYVLDESGRSIHKFDPWSPKHADVCMYFPETPSTIYTASKISASASTIMAIGYEVNLETKKKSLKIITKMGDIDTEGWNPGLKYCYTKNENNPRMRVLPIGVGPDGKEWREHTLPEGAEVTSTLTIRQTGKGNEARELRIEGKNKEGSWGFFHKKISANDWAFTKTKDKASKKNLGNILSDTDELDENYHETTTVHDYQSINDKAYSVKVNTFGEHSYHSTITLTKDDKTYVFPLNKKHGLASFLGVKTYLYEVVISNEMQKDEFVKKTFRVKDVTNEVLKVKIQQRNNELQISGGGIKWRMKEIESTRSLHKKVIKTSR